MHLDKAKKRIAKHISKDFHGYPHITLAYFGVTAECASEVVVQFVAAEGTAAQEQRFASNQDARQDETIQSVLLKIIERADAKTVTLIDGVAMLTAS